MKIKHDDYLEFEISDEFCVEEEGDMTCIYKENGTGAMTLSFYTIFQNDRPLFEQISIMAKNFIQKNKIALQKSFVLDTTQKGKMVLCGSGKTADKWYITLWIVARKNKIVMATYQNQSRSYEVNEYQKIIDSMNFVFDNG